MGNPGVVGAGGVFRGFNGSWFRGFHMDLRITTSVVAELNPLQQGLKLAIDCNIQTLYVELDARTVLERTQRGTNQSTEQLDRHYVDRLPSARYWLSTGKLNEQVKCVQGHAKCKLIYTVSALQEKGIDPQTSIGLSMYFKPRQWRMDEPKHRRWGSPRSHSQDWGTRRAPEPLLQLDELQPVEDLLNPQ
ncbi:hypothetical protein CRG98_023877 [Punica granatum]|uniref:RNase H type-1 domain-containing protein n=1 Tax=Punica granatum TaxID=22663 RepID=A0A2I0JHP4_PUNGR|nr:hypothetical protein CRG98_023877 [Punica granatum]